MKAPDTELTGGLGVPAVAAQEPAAEAAAATEVLGDAAGFPGAAEPWRIAVPLSAGQQHLPSVSLSLLCQRPCCHAPPPGHSPVACQGILPGVALAEEEEEGEQGQP